MPSTVTAESTCAVCDRKVVYATYDNSTEARYSGWRHLVTTNSGKEVQRGLWGGHKATPAT